MIHYRNYEGAGLDCAISKCYIDLLGGKIWAEKQPDKRSSILKSLH
jgi:signal transduction histidine kinase